MSFKKNITIITMMADVLKLAIVLVVFSVIIGCGSDSNPRPDVNVLENTNGLETVTASGTADDLNLVFAPDSSQAKDIEQDEYVVAGITPSTPTGVLRKVKSVEEADDGSVIVVTEQAKLTDVVDDGESEVSGRLNATGDSSTLDGASYSEDSGTFETVQNTGYTVYGEERPFYEIPECSSKSFYLDANEIELKDNSGDVKGTMSGCVGFDLDFVLNMDIRNAKLQSAEFSIAPSVGTQVEVHVSGAEADLALQFKVATIDLQPIVFAIGPIPVVIVPKLHILMGLNGKVTINIDAKYTNDLSTKVGVKFVDGQWQNIKENHNEYSFDMPTLNGDINAQVYMGPEITFLLYGIAGPGANVFLYSRIISNFDQDNPDSEWEVWMGVQAGAHFSVELFNTELFRIGEPAIIGYEGLVASSRFDGIAPPGSGARVTGIIGDAINGTYQTPTGDDFVDQHLSGTLVTVGATIVGMIPMDGEAAPRIIVKDSYGRGVGTIPTSCSSEEDYDAGLCYDKCSSGYYGVGPVCWQSCPDGYADHGASCYKDFFTWFFKNSYGRGVGTIPSSCSSEQDYDAGLCYNKCALDYTGVGPVCWENCPSGFNDDGAFCRIINN